jgi:hypothetical protein
MNFVDVNSDHRFEEFFASKRGIGDNFIDFRNKLILSLTFFTVVRLSCLLNGRSSTNEPRKSIGLTEALSSFWVNVGLIVAIMSWFDG